MSGDLAVWLRAQLDADELTAAAARPGTWHVGTPKDTGVPVDDSDGYIVAETGISAAHIALFNPAFVLADIAAKKAVVDMHSVVGKTTGHCAQCRAPYPCLTLRLLARPYRGRDGWREEWE